MLIYIEQEEMDELAQHLDHELDIGIYQNTDGPVSIGIECVECGLVLVSLETEDKPDWEEFHK